MTSDNKGQVNYTLRQPVAGYRTARQNDPNDTGAGAFDINFSISGSTDSCRHPNGGGKSLQDDRAFPFPGGNNNITFMAGRLSVVENDRLVINRSGDDTTKSYQPAGQADQNWAF